MKNKHDGCVRGFHHYRAAWYGNVGNLGRDVVDEINIGMYHPEGGTTGEFSVKWEELSGKVVARLNVYDDGWSALAHFGDALARMSTLDGPTIAPEAFCELLVSCGVVDLTDRRVPASVEDARLETSRVEAAAPDLLRILVDTYYRLADIRNEWPGRSSLAGQKRLCDMRDCIAKALGMDAKDVYEGAAMQMGVAP